MLVFSSLKFSKEPETRVKAKRKQRGRERAKTRLSTQAVRGRKIELTQSNKFYPLRKKHTPKLQELLTHIIRFFPTGRLINRYYLAFFIALVRFFHTTAVGDLTKKGDLKTPRGQKDINPHSKTTPVGEK